jgi:hypothetical protein
VPITTGEPLAVPEPELPLVLEPEFAALLALEELLLLEPPHPVSTTAIAATAAADNIQALRLDLVIWTFSSPGRVTPTCGQ